MKIKTKVIFTIVACLGVAAAVVINLIDRSYRNNLQLVTEEALAEAQQGLDNLEKNDTRTLLASLEALRTNDKIREVFLKNDPEALYNLTRPLYESFKQRYHITHWYFIKPDGTCFLRVHDRAQSGDVVKRATFAAAVATKDFGAGKELGKTAFALRAVRPWYDEHGTLLGYLELAEEIDHFLSMMKQQTGNEYGLLVKKGFLDEKNWASARAAQGLKNNWGDRAEQVLVDTTSSETSFIAYDGDLASLPDGGTVVQTMVADGKAYVRGLVPVYDAARRKVGGVFVLHDITPMYVGMKSTRNLVTIAIFGLMVALSGIMIFMLGRLIFRRLHAVTETATRVVGGDFETHIVCSSEDEVGELEGLLEQFRAVFVNTLGDLKEARSKGKG